MRSINVRYLLTYLLTGGKRVSNCSNAVSVYKSRLSIGAAGRCILPSTDGKSSGSTSGRGSAVDIGASRIGTAGIVVLSGISNGCRGNAESTAAADRKNECNCEYGGVYVCAESVNNADVSTS